MCGGDGSECCAFKLSYVPYVEKCTNVCMEGRDAWTESPFLASGPFVFDLMVLQRGFGELAGFKMRT